MKEILEQLNSIDNRVDELESSLKSELSIIAKDLSNVLLRVKSGKSKGRAVIHEGDIELIYTPYRPRVTAFFKVYNKAGINFIADIHRLDIRILEYID